MMAQHRQVRLLVIMTLASIFPLLLLQDVKIPEKTARMTVSSQARSGGEELALPSYPWQFIHPFKTGTSFVNTLYMLGCPEDYRSNWTQSELISHAVQPLYGIETASKECKQRWVQGEGYGWGETRALRPQWWLGEHAFRNLSLTHSQIFMTFREPVDRMISQLVSQGHIKKIRKVTNSEIAMDIIQRIHGERRIGTPDLGQHMTSFLFPPGGEVKWHSDTRSLTSLTEQACQIVDNMAWVGLTEAFQESVCLLHARFNFPRHPLEIENMRPTKSREKMTINATLVGIMIRNQTMVTDDVVYDCARQRFWRDLERWAPHCMQTA